MVVKHRRNKKRWAIEYKGGCCKVCGYDRCEAALVFHHRAEEDKEFSFAGSSGWCRSYERLKKELDKCDLLCANCHLELHYC